MSNLLNHSLTAKASDLSGILQSANAVPSSTRNESGFRLIWSLKN